MSSRVGKATLCKSWSAMSPPLVGGNDPASLPQKWRNTFRHVQIHLIDVTPGPPFTGFGRGHHRMGRMREMFRGVAIGRAVTTADMTASQAETEMHPGRSELQAFFTSLSASGNGLKSGHV